MTGVFVRIKHHVKTKRMPCDNGDKDWCDIDASQRVSRIYSHYHNLGIGKKGFDPGSQREHGPVHALILNRTVSE